MEKVSCAGSPFQIGIQHGTQASLHISRSISFYRNLFQTKCGMSWDEVKSFALKYQHYLAEKWPDYVLEMEGVARGAGEGVGYADILALNVRTEIAFGAFSDGCTALSWKGKEKSILAQNWDWNTEQAENLISLHITHSTGLAIHMITEAGIIGKIGMNSHGVGCTLNAIKAKGVAYDKLPCHLALRTVMESSSRAAAVETLEREGVASACHILVADATGGTGVECSSVDIVLLEMEKDGGAGVVTHTNHYLRPHAASVVEVDDWLPDTRFRVERIGEFLCEANKKGDEPSVEAIEAWLKDETVGEHGASICRSAKNSGGLGLATLFGIMMDLGEKKGKVMVGRPAEEGEVIEIKF